MKTKRICFSKPYLTTVSDNFVRVNCDIKGIRAEDDSVNIWYEVDLKYEKYLVTERVDGFLVGMLPYLMVHAENDGSTEIVLESPISEKLCYQLTQYFIPTMAQFTDVYNSFTLKCETDSNIFSNEMAVGTGISGGVDSFYTALTHMETPLNGYKLTHGLYCNVGYLGGFQGTAEMAQESLSEEISNELGLSFITVKSNLCQEIYKITHAMIIVNLFASFPLILQKLFSVYYLSSEVPFPQFSLDVDDAEHFDLLNAHCFSTESLSFYSAGSETTRIRKTEYISKSPLARRKLFVCRDVTHTPLKNCSRCSKCTRTMVQLDALNKLDMFDEVFDVEAFRKNPNYYYGYFVFRGKKHVYNEETFAEMKKRGKRFPFGGYIAGMIKIIRHGFKRENPLAKQYRP